jgi:tetratricopeptide (TPR) repeat protein
MKKTLGLLALLVLAGKATAAPHTRTIVVFPFVNQSTRSDLAWMSEGLAVALSRRLSGPNRYILSRRERNAAYEDVGLVEGAPITLASAYRVAETLGVDWAVIGTFDVQGSQLTAKARLLDVRGLKLYEPLVASGGMADFVELETDLAWRMLSEHDPTFAAVKEEDFRRKFPEVPLDAFESYIRGILATDANTGVQFLTEADRRNPADHRAAFELGRFYFEQKDYASSVAWFRKLTPTDDHYLEAQFRLGVGEYFLGHDKEAAKDFELVARQLPLSEAYNNLGVVEYRGGHFADALEDFERAKHGGAVNSKFSFNRGACLWSLKRYPEAARALKSALETNEDDGEAHLLLADTLARLGDDAGAQKEKKWLADHEGSSSPVPANPTPDYSPQPRIVKDYDGGAFRLLALTIRNAVEARLSKLPPAQHAAGHVARSRRLINEGNYPEAEQDLAEAISLDPSNNEAHLLMAQVYEGEGRHQDAAAQLETALKLNNSVGAQLWLARIYLSLGQFPKAEEHSRAALALAPANHEAERLAREVQQRVSAAGSEP